MELDGAERDELLLAMLGAFPSVEDLRRVVASVCHRDLEVLVPTGGPRERATGLIQRAESEGWTRELVTGMHGAHPRHARLHRFMQGYLASVQRSIPRRSLERIVGSWAEDGGADGWRRRLAAIERRVCRVEPVLGASLGTGFLVSRNVVLTNFHVIENRLLESLRVRFDHKVLPDRTLLQSGTRYAVKRCIARSSYSPADLMHPRPREATVDELDYAFLQVEGAPGEEPVEDEPRGWLELPEVEVPIILGSLALIVQHPEGQPMSVALDEFLAVNASRTRVSYRTSTSPGSSGAPCFTQDLRLAALHHSGGPRMPSATGHNEGIPTDTIRRSLSREVKALLGWE
ncbi:trypsin-like peptidase domain-containing protein [Myxococcus sp. AM011]|uniref:trypsin-like peptidase domain-containing protein n=1 Tax=Myxococcus sp. AM011 TaxID=2745200 RepID=UPI0015962C5A|nr:trypsin-like peptidase domain-containing protein [Myxococcus sp. AM011]NVJ26923.1 trypsin-like peptidase domain-containing protein [Myxococcus sp. AM011]